MNTRSFVALFALLALPLTAGVTGCAAPATEDEEADDSYGAASDKEDDDKGKAPAVSSKCPSMTGNLSGSFQVIDGAKFVSAPVTFTAKEKGTEKPGTEIVKQVDAKGALPIFALKEGWWTVSIVYEGERLSTDIATSCKFYDRGFQIMKRDGKWTLG